MEWLSKITPPVRSFDELVNKFITQYSYNIQHAITMLDVCNTKQKNNETFMMFLQRWRRMVSRYPRDIPEKEKMEIFIDNLNGEMSYRLKLQCIPSFAKLIENGIQVEEACVKKGTLKFYKEGTNSSNYNNQNNTNLNKSRFWTRNKNEGNNETHDPKSKQPVLALSENPQNTKNPKNANPNANTYAPNTNQGKFNTNNTNDTQSKNMNLGPNNNSRNNTNNFQKRIFTPLGQSLESAFRELLAHKILSLPPISNYEPQIKPPWWNDSHYCDYHRNKGHQMNNCMRLKHMVQDMIDRGDLTIDGLKTNGDHGAFKNPLPNYNKDGASTSNDPRGARINHIYNNTINHISAEDHQVNVITIRDKCDHESVNVTTRT
ncbi:hypothetical protein SUGI_0642360 [Cryptomeria japonica]|nr:hypothetical protein SUGI_0642360 [Cryptomeria japonica]